MHKLKQLLTDLEPAIADIIKQPGSPRAVYEPISYILSLGGKRIRPAMVLAAYKLYKTEYSPEVMQVAQAVEMFHNFTLLHDDIMDNSPLRRGQETVHIKWDDATAILSGDLLQIEVYEKLTEVGNVEILRHFNKMACELCEGQMNDMQFEQMGVISNEAYLDMIRQKTAVLLGFSLQAGAILGGASKEEGEKLYDLGISIGLSFQLMDDYLDSFGDTAKVGKRIGGDILEKKKTYLWNEMWSRIDEDQRAAVLASYSSEESAIAFVKQTQENTGAKDFTLKLAQDYTSKGLTALDSFNTTLGDKGYLEEIVKMLAGRES
ncbi:polyprenyl synthetase family protein [Bacteroidia bacterium]|nr:polyprenyl synthetase family protein [Bacteroidia bacterium]MDC1395543.1 polyprenyl synthetase family protein [Bacteroidia bacterium]